MNLMKTNPVKLPPARRRAFTLIELLVVISIIGVLAALLFPAMSALKKQQYLSKTKAEMALLETALENYKAKYGVYPPSNQNPTNSYLPLDRSQFSQLYYELAGTTNNGTAYLSPDGNQILGGDVKTAYGVGGFINCSKGNGEDVSLAQNFLLGFNSKQIYNPVTNTAIPTTMIPTTMVVASVGGPDAKYQPLNGSGLNPFRYVYPGVYNPNSYDLWVQLSIGSSFAGVNAFTKTNKYLVCNWTKQVIRNSPLP